MAAAEAESLTSALAMEELCGLYWYPLYAFVRHQGYSEPEAEDLTQGFFAQFIERECLANVGREKGRFRAFLLVCLKRFLCNVREHQQAAKRGGGRKRLSLDFEDAAARYSLEPSHSVTPEKLYERNWAMLVLERALQSVAGEFAARGREKVFQTLKVYLVADENAPGYAETAVALAMSETAVKVAVHRLRERYRQAVEEQLAQTLGEGDSLDEEIGQLLAAMAT